MKCKHLNLLLTPIFSLRWYTTVSGNKDHWEHYLTLRDTASIMEAFSELAPTCDEKEYKKIMRRDDFHDVLVKLLDESTRLRGASRITKGAKRARKE